MFLLRPELRDYWDFSIFVKAGFETTLARALKRDVALFGSEAEVRRRYDHRYVPGQKLYFVEAAPEGWAKVVLNNEDVNGPIMQRRG